MTISFVYNRSMGTTFSMVMSSMPSHCENSSTICSNLALNSMTFTELAYKLLPILLEKERQMGSMLIISMEYKNMYMSLGEILNFGNYLKE